VRRLAALVAPLGLLLAACGDDTGDATVSFTQPADDATVAGGLVVKMSAEGITIEEAGEVHEGAGHFHVIADDGCARPGETVPRDADHVHFGGGQTEGTIYLEPGTHELCLQAGDGSHVALDATDGVTVEVAITDRDQWCAVVGETDELFTAADTDGDKFPIRQVAYENIRRLIAQLEDALDQVDSTDRDLVATSLTSADRIAEAFTIATDEQNAERLIQPIFEAVGANELNAGAPWILDNCGVDIDG
jgi:hypothetical protein